MSSVAAGTTTSVEAPDGTRSEAGADTIGSSVGAVPTWCGTCRARTRCSQAVDATSFGLMTAMGRTVWSVVWVTMSTAPTDEMPSSPWSRSTAGGSREGQAERRSSCLRFHPLSIGGQHSISVHQGLAERTAETETRRRHTKRRATVSGPIVSAEPVR